MRTAQRRSEGGNVMKVYKNAISRIALVAIATALTVATVGPVVPAAAAPSNTVLNWNATTVAALMNLPTAVPPGAGQPPTVGVIHMAMVQGAVYRCGELDRGRVRAVPGRRGGASGSVDRCGGRDGRAPRVDPGDPARGAADGCHRSGMRSWRGVQTQYETELAAIPPGDREVARRGGGCGRRRGDARKPDGRRAVPDARRSCSRRAQGSVNGVRRTARATRSRGWRTCVRSRCGARRSSGRPARTR